MNNCDWFGWRWHFICHLDPTNSLHYYIFILLNNIYFKQLYDIDDTSLNLRSSQFATEAIYRRGKRVFFWTFWLFLNFCCCYVCLSLCFVCHTSWTCQACEMINERCHCQNSMVMRRLVFASTWEYRIVGHTFYTSHCQVFFFFLGKSTFFSNTNYFLNTHRNVIRSKGWQSVRNCSPRDNNEGKNIINGQIWWQNVAMTKRKSSIVLNGCADWT